MSCSYLVESEGSNGQAQYNPRVAAENSKASLDPVKWSILGVSVKPEDGGCQPIVKSTKSNGRHSMQLAAQWKAIIRISFERRRGAAPDAPEWIGALLGSDRTHTVMTGSPRVIRLRRAVPASRADGL